MGQFFHFANLDAQETTRGISGKLGEDIWKSQDYITILLTKYWSVDGSSMNIWTKRSPAILRVKCSAKAPILRLPNELLHAIFDNLDDLMSTMSLCIAHDILGLVGEALLREFVVPEPYGPWAGDRIICIGENCQADPGSFPPDLQDEVLSQVAAYVQTIDEDPEGPSTFFHCVSETYTNRHPRQLGYYDLDLWEWRMSRQDYRKAREVEQAMNCVRVDADISNPELVLCNLTKGVYVRNDAVNDIRDWARKNPDWGWDISLGTVLVTRICWSTDSSCNMDDALSERLTQGDWAGDRFEIVPLDKMQPDIEWQDVTDEAMAWRAVGLLLAICHRLVFSPPQVYSEHYVVAMSVKNGRRQP